VRDGNYPDLVVQMAIMVAFSVNYCENISFANSWRGDVIEIIPQNQAFSEYQ
jgi:hypothetical protein